MNLADQTVLITGGGNGIGRHLVSNLVRDARKVVVIDKDQAALNDLQVAFEGVSGHVCDLTRHADVERTIQTVCKENQVTVLINNAGLIHSEPLINLLSREDKKHSVENWHRTIDANLHTVFYVTSCVVEKMVETRTKGLIVNISSISANGNVGQSAYSAAKAAVNALTVTWSKELGMFGIRSAAIAPGFIDTPSTRRSLSEANLSKWQKSTPLGRLGQLEEISNSVRFLIENDFYTGRIVELDGGLRI